MVFAAAMRGGMIWALHDNLNEDIDAYHVIAENLRQHGVYSRQPTQEESDVSNQLRPTAYRPPLYPMLLSRIGAGPRLSNTTVAILHILLGVGTVALVYLLAHLWQIEKWGIVAGIFVACDPILLHWSTFTMTETLATFLAVTSLVSLTYFSRDKTPWSAGLTGGLLALATLCRPTFFVWLIFAAAFAVFMKVRWTRRCLNPAAMLIMAALILLPWTLRNYGLFGRPIFATTHGGYTLLLGNNPYFYAYLRQGNWGMAWEADQFHEGWKRERKNVGEFADDQQAYALALDSIREEPGMFLFASVVRVGRLWSPMPHQLSKNESSKHRLLRYMTASWYAVIFVLAIAGTFVLRGQLLQTPWVWGVLLLLSITAVHTFYWSNMRMRAPLMPLVCLLAAVGVECFARQRAERNLLRESELEQS